MDILTVDMETFYDRHFSLSKMTTEEYIRDELFEVIGVSVKRNDEEPEWVSGTKAQVKRWLEQWDWGNSVGVAHNAMFDMAILNWHFDIRPKRIADTLSMLRAIDGPDAGNSLAKAAERYGLGVKGTEVVNALGKGRLDFSPSEMAAYAQYCINDVELTYKLFEQLAPLLPVSEMRLIDLTIRMFSEPVLVLDKDVLTDHLKDVQDKKGELLGKALISKDNLMSNEKLADTLRSLDVDPPTKTSPTTGKETYAFAKTDEAFKALLDHDNVIVQSIVAARLGVKSTLEETRTERLIGIADRGPLPVPLRYYAAHCLTGDAEVLSPHGWVRLDRWRGGDIAQWSPDNTLHFAAATPNVFMVDEDLVVSESRYHKAVYTKGHTVPGFTGRGVFKALKAGELLRKRLEIPLGGALDGGNDITELDARLAAMTQADGSVRDTCKDRSVRFGFKKPRKIARCKALLEQGGIEYTQGEEAGGAVRIRVSARHYAPLLKLLSSAKKNFSKDLLSASLAVKQAFMDEIAFWDGDTEPHEQGYTYTTTNEGNAQLVQTMAHLIGKSAFVSTRERGGRNWSTTYRVYIRKDTTTRSQPAHYTTRHHTGWVYCPTTETGYFLMRQEGQIHVTGNTGRWGGDDKINLQNLPRKSPLKKAIKAPPGYTFIDCDSSQIEARTLAWLAGQDDLVEAFDRGEDVYKIMASAIYGVPVDEVTDEQRFVGKTTILGAGYGMGPIKFQAQLKNFGVSVPIEECGHIISTYRHTYSRIPLLWQQASNALQALINQRTAPLGREGVLTVDLLGIRLPNGMYIRYPNLRTARKPDGNTELVYDTNKGRAVVPTRIYGGKCVENICQALARIIIGEQMLMVARRYRVVQTVHDAVGSIAPDAEADEARTYVETCMRIRPKWASGLPLNCESKMGASYGG